MPSRESLFDFSSSSYYGWAVKRERIIEYCRAHRLGGTTANPEHLARLKAGVGVWNQWRREHPEADPDFSTANLSDADLIEANLSEADLTHATLVKTNLEGANLTACSVYGISVWSVRLEGAIQSNLVITPKDESAIHVDNLQVAQFIYLLLNNENIRDVIDTVGRKAVLILGRFTPDRKVVLDAIREALRKNGYLPILFDFEKPSTRDTHETIVTLAGMVRFIIADITDPKSIPQELASIVPNLPSVPVQPLLQYGFEPWGMYDHIERYPWVLPLVPYENQEALLTALPLKVIAPAEAKAKEQARKRKK